MGFRVVRRVGLAPCFRIRKISSLSLYLAQLFALKRIMELQRFTTEELERLLEVLPEEIRRRELQQDEVDEAERRKRSVFASFEELARKQGVKLTDL